MQGGGPSLSLRAARAACGKNAFVVAIGQLDLIQAASSGEVDTVCELTRNGNAAESSSCTEQNAQWVWSRIKN